MKHDQDSVRAGKDLAGVTTESESQLTGLALDVVMAERVMGWRTHKVVETVWYMPESHNSITKERWQPSTDIAAAMQVVEEMRTGGWSFACTLYEGELPYASFCRGTADTSKHAEANLLTEAICRAALAATEAAYQHAEGGTA